MHITLGCLEVKLRNTYQRGKTIIYQRAVPRKLRDRYPGATVKHDLKTNDLILPLDCVSHNRAHELACLASHSLSNCIGLT